MTPLLTYPVFALGLMVSAHFSGSKITLAPEKTPVETQVIKDLDLDNEKLDRQVFDQYNILRKSSLVKKTCTKTDESHDNYYCKKLNAMLFCIKKGSSKQSAQQARDLIMSGKATKKDFKIAGISGFCDHDPDKEIHFIGNDFHRLNYQIKNLLNQKTSKEIAHEISASLKDIAKVNSTWSGYTNEK